MKTRKTRKTTKRKRKRRTTRRNAEGNLRVFRGVVRSKGGVWLGNAEAHAFIVQMHMVGKLHGMQMSQMRITVAITAPSIINLVKEESA
jgi:hypothetical protein